MRFAKAVLLVATIGISAGVARADFMINSTPWLFVPSFRADGHQAGETYFGWLSGQWDGNPDTPAPNVDTLNLVPSVNPQSLPTGPGGANFTQNVVADIVSGSDNLFSSSTASVDLNLNIPTDGTPGTGFTTIIIQGRGLGSGMGVLNHVLFGQINGQSPTIAMTQNALSPAAKQWWVKYELPGNDPLYTVQITGGPGASVTFPISVNELLIDTYWSPTGFAADTASVPEPATVGMLAAGAAMLMRRSRRNNRENYTFGGQEHAN